MAARDRVRERANAAGGEVAVTSKAPPILRMLSEDAKTRDEITKALLPGMDTERYLRVARTQIQQNPDLLRCDPRSIISAIHKAAAYGLDLGPVGQAYLVPFKDQAQLVIGYRGMLALARRSGELASIEAREVKENDYFEYEYGLDPKLRHIPALGNRGKLIGFWGLARFVNGGSYMVVVDLDTIEEHRRASARGANNVGPWNDNYEAMGRKTVIRIMEPMLPLTVEAVEAFAADANEDLDDSVAFIDTTAERPVDAFVTAAEDEPVDEPPPDEDGY